MKSIASLLIACAVAVTLEPELDDKAFLPDMNMDMDMELPEAECNGCRGCVAPICCVDQLDCNCHLPADCGNGYGSLQEYQAGSRAINEAYKQQVPDKLYGIDAISCTDQSTAANSCAESQLLGNHIFEITGSIQVAEKYEDKSQEQRQERERSNACYHREQRTQLCDNLPCPEAGPCVCACSC